MTRLSLSLLLTSALALPAAAQVRILQSNAAGDEAHIIDPATNKVVMRIPDLEAAHGVVGSPDGSRIYFTVESDNTVRGYDSRSGKLLGRVKLSGHPNNLAVAKDGRYVFAGIAEGPGAIDVIDTATWKNIKSIPVNGAVHNVYMTPDGKYAYSGSVGGGILSVIDAQKFEKVWELKMSSGIRPMTAETNPDGSTKRLFIQLSDLHGFSVVDFNQRKEVARIEMPKEPANGTAHSGTPNHGIGVSPDGKLLAVNSHILDGVYIYSLPDLKLIGGVRTGHVPDWLTWTPDSKMVYVANAAHNNVSAVDVAALKEVAKIPVGEVPKRNATLVLPKP
jgi:YVTN family beta-propeller protein